MSKKVFFLIFLILLSLFITIFVYNDDFLYSKEIMKIDKITTKKIDEEQNSLGLKEKYYLLNISGTITNGRNKGGKKNISYEESYSSIVTDKYKVGDKVFIVNDSIDGLKRDTYITILFFIFIISIFIVGEYSGLLSVLSVVINSTIFYLGIILYSKGINLLIICFLEIILFTILSLFLANGINTKTTSAIISSFISILCILFIVLIIFSLNNYKGINFNGMGFLTVPPEAVFLSELLIGSLGAIMDVSITISSSIAELINKDKNISIDNLNKSSKEIGKDIMSTMTNVLFFTYLCSGLPTLVLALRNGFSMYNYIVSNYSLELSRFLVGSIGIIISIPIATFISIKFFKRGDNVE